jgi:hypothetical protein
MYDTMKKKTKTIQRLLTSNRKKTVETEATCMYIYMTALFPGLEVTSIEIDDVKLVLCSQASPLSKMMRSCKCFLRQ